MWRRVSCVLMLQLGVLRSLLFLIRMWGVESSEWLGFSCLLETDWGWRISEWTSLNHCVTILIIFPEQCPTNHNSPRFLQEVQLRKFHGMRRCFALDWKLESSWKGNCSWQSNEECLLFFCICLLTTFLKLNTNCFRVRPTTPFIPTNMTPRIRLCKQNHSTLTGSLGQRWCCQLCSALKRPGGTAAPALCRGV